MPSPSPFLPFPLPSSIKPNDSPLGQKEIDSSAYVQFRLLSTTKVMDGALTTFSFYNHQSMGHWKVDTHTLDSHSKVQRKRQVGVHLWAVSQFSLQVANYDVILLGPCRSVVVSSHAGSSPPRFFQAPAFTSPTAMGGGKSLLRSCVPLPLHKHGRSQSFSINCSALSSCIVILNEQEKIETV